MEDIVDALNAAEKALFDYFGIEQGWSVYPVSDDRSLFWRIFEGQVLFAPNIEGVSDVYEPYYSNWIMNNNIFRKEKYTAILVDTQTDGNKWYSIYDNSKEVKTNN